MNDKLRYPGVNYFTEADADIFCGRKNDSEQLYTQTILGKTTVLHAESGIGKSSLIEAGLIPLVRLRNPNIVPVTIRFVGDKKLSDKDTDKPKPDSILIQETITAIEQLAGKPNTAIPLLTELQNDIWYIAKQFEKNGKHLLLIFDQFEVLQSYSERQVVYFKKKLAELFASSVPEGIYDIIEEESETALQAIDETAASRALYSENLRFIEQPLHVKAIFVVREDKLGTMSLLSDYFPDILKNDFLLAPLDRVSARAAITEPANAPRGTKFKFGPFEYTSGALEFLLGNLTDSDTGFIDPIQLQIVCSSIEKTIVKDNPERKISKENIPAVGDILNKFYADIWSAVYSEHHQHPEIVDKWKEELLGELIVNGKRNLVHQDNLVRNEQDSAIIKQLLSGGLIRKITSGHSDVYYQLCHDRLVLPLQQDLRSISLIKKTREDVEKGHAEEAKKRQRRTQLITVGVLILVSILCVNLYLKNRDAQRLQNELRQSQYYAEAKRLLNVDPVMVYRLMTEGNSIDPESGKFDVLLQEYDHDSAGWISKEIPIESSIFAVSNSASDNLFTIVDESGINKWRYPGLLQERIVLKNIIGAFTTGEGKISVFCSAEYSNDTVWMYDENGKVQATFYTDFTGAPIGVSDDGQTVIIGSHVYRTGNNYPIAYIKGNALGYGSKISFLTGDQFAISASESITEIYTLKGIRGANDTLIPLKESPNKGVLSPVLLSDSSYAFLYNKALYHCAKEFCSDKIFELDAAKKIETVTDVMELSGTHDGKYLHCITEEGFLILDFNFRQLGELKLKTDYSQLVQISESGKTALVATENTVIVWHPGKPDLKKMALRSPYDYRQLGFENHEFSLYGDTSNISDLVSATNHYAQRARVNKPWDHSEYDDNILNTSLEEIDLLYQRIFQHPDFKTLSKVTQQQVHFLYSKLINESANYFSETEWNDTTYLFAMKKADSLDLAGIFLSPEGAEEDVNMKCEGLLYTGSELTRIGLLEDALNCFIMVQNAAVRFNTLQPSNDVFANYVKAAMSMVTCNKIAGNSNPEKVLQEAVLILRQRAKDDLIGSFVMRQTMLSVGSFYRDTLFDYESAIEAHREVAAYDDPSAGYNAVATDFICSKQPDSADHYLNMSLQLNKKDFDALVLKTMTALVRNDNQSANQYFDETKRVNNFRTRYSMRNLIARLEYHKISTPAMEELKNKLEVNFR